MKPSQLSVKTVSDLFSFNMYNILASVPYINTLTTA